jgi:hypothetical protein
LVVISGGNTVDKNSSDYSDKHGHGTHVAGTIAALDNSIGVLGVAPSAGLYAVKVLNNAGMGSTTSVIKGIQWAVDNGMNVVNMSFGSSTFSQAEKDACDNAYNNNVLLVAAAGNSGNESGTGDNVGYPAKYSSVIAVAATDEDDRRAYFSSTGDQVELSAPGVKILSTYKSNSYATASGTSMASPHVAGVAALVWSKYQEWNNSQVREILGSTATFLGDPLLYGAGLVDAAKALDITGDSTTYYTLEVKVEGSGTTSPSVGEYTYAAGQEVTLTADADDGWVFEKWVIDGTETETAIASVTMDGDKIATAHFVQDTSEQPPADPPAALGVVITTDKDTYSPNSWVYITVTVTDSNAVQGANVELRVTDPGGKTSIGQAVTDAEGKAYFRYRVGPKAVKGTYTVTALADKDGVTGNAESSFTVQ